MNVSKSDVIWSYAAQFFNVATGVLVLPLILHLLNTNEIAFYYIILNIGTLVNLFDFGFSAQFSRNFAYVFNGAQELQTEGLSENVNCEVNYRLLKTLIITAANVYRIISLIVIFTMLTAGSFYIRKVTNNFTLVDKSFYIWVLYSISIFFNMYFMYLNQMVMGKGLIKKNQQAIVFSRLAYLIIVLSLLLLNFSLFAVVIANFVSPFVSRFILLKAFYSKELKKKLANEKISNPEKRECFHNIWHNAKKLGVVSIGGFLISKSGMFFAGLYLNSSEIASFGLLLQLINIINGLSITLYNAYVPKMTGYLVNNDIINFKKSFSVVLVVFYFIYFICCMGVLTVCPILLSFIRSNAALPIKSFVLLYCIVSFLEQHHSVFAGVISLTNKIPYVVPSIISGICIVIGLFLSLRYSNLGIWCMAIISGVVQVCYNNWKWPVVVCKQYNESILGFIKIFCKEYLRNERTVE